jgi:hypothetical protein
LPRYDCQTYPFWKDPKSMKLKKQILEKDPAAISTFVDQLRWNIGIWNFPRSVLSPLKENPISRFRGLTLKPK